MYNYGFPLFCITMGVFHSFACVTVYFLFYASRNSPYTPSVSVGWPGIQSSAFGIEYRLETRPECRACPTVTYATTICICTNYHPCVFSTRSYCLHIAQSAPFSQIRSHLVGNMMQAHKINLFTIGKTLLTLFLRLMTGRCNKQSTTECS